MLLVHHFALPRVSGLTVTVDELRQLLPAVDPRVVASCLDYDGIHEPAGLTALLDQDHESVSCVIGFNLHIEVSWELSVALAAWCDRREVTFLLYVHDYWPHHRDNVAALVERFGARLLAITPAIVEDLAADGFSAQLLRAGVAVPGAPSAPRAAEPSAPVVVASVARLVPRKRIIDIVAGFGCAGLGDAARLYVRAPPSLVYPQSDDRAMLASIHAAQRNCPQPGHIEIDDRPRQGTDYGNWDLYVCASEYEGVSMTPLEAILQGCPVLLSDIAPHRHIVGELFGGRFDDFLFPVGDHDALAALLRDEVATGERHADVQARADAIHEIIADTWSLRRTARDLAALALGAEAVTDVGVRRT